MTDRRMIATLIVIAVGAIVISSFAELIVNLFDPASFNQKTRSRLLNLIEINSSGSCHRFSSEPTTETNDLSMFIPDRMGSPANHGLHLRNVAFLQRYKDNLDANPDRKRH